VIGKFSGGVNRSANKGLASVVWRNQCVQWHPSPCVTIHVSFHASSQESNGAIARSGHFRTIWSCSGGYGMRAYRAMAEAAGVHFYLGPEFVGDAVEAQGSAMVGILIRTGPY
jgi:hypothetical protein